MDQIITYKHNHHEEDIPQLHQQHVALNSGKWVKDQMTRKCANIKEWNIYRLHVGWNSLKTILKQISPISFPWLVLLCLSGNSIESIEGIDRMNLLRLQRIELSYNNLCCIKSIRKAPLFELKTISLLYNRVVDQAKLNEAPFTRLRTLENEDRLEVATQMPNVAELVKLKTEDMRAIYIQGGQRIQELRLYRTIRRKYQNVKVYGQ